MSNPFLHPWEMEQREEASRRLADGDGTATPTHYRAMTMCSKHYGGSGHRDPVKGSESKTETTPLVPKEKQYCRVETDQGACNPEDDEDGSEWCSPDERDGNDTKEQGCSPEKDVGHCRVGTYVGADTD